MPVKISNGELFDFIVGRGNFQDRSASNGEKFKRLVELLQHERGIEDGEAKKVLLVLQQVYAVRNKNEKWRKKLRSFRSKNDEDEEMGKKEPDHLLVQRQKDIGRTPLQNTLAKQQKVRFSKRASKMLPCLQKNMVFRKRKY